jgi:hypothetical protein
MSMPGAVGHVLSYTSSAIIGFCHMTIQNNFQPDSQSCQSAAIIYAETLLPSCSPTVKLSSSPLVEQKQSDNSARPSFQNWVKLDDKRRAQHTTALLLSCDSRWLTDSASISQVPLTGASVSQSRDQFALLSRCPTVETACICHP